MTPEERLKKLETRCRRLTHALATAALLGSAGILTGATYQLQGGGEVVEARGFVVKDPAGRRRAALSITGDEPGLDLWDASGTRRVALAVLKNRDLQLNMYGADGKKRLVLALGAQKDYAGVFLYGSNQNIQAILSSSGQNLSFLMTDAQKTNRLGMAVSPGASEIILWDSTGKAKWRAADK